VEHVLGLESCARSGQLAISVDDIVIEHLTLFPSSDFRIPRVTMEQVRQPIHIEPKAWGREVWIVNTPLYCGKILEIERGKRCSLHYHKLKTETFYLRSGRLWVRIKQSPDARTTREFEMTVGQCMDIKPGLVHQMEALEDAELFEFSTQHFDSDSHRLTPAHQRSEHDR
jgi:mannose-6-phosphate isomerase-like protein (cupin superfamily)